MSKTIDQRVVEMQFDNRHFERNVSTTMSTLEKLKQRLNLNGSAKGLESVNAAANKVNMSGLSSAIDTVGARFSAMEVIGVTALANITNSAVNAGKRIISALTIEPVTTGFSEYELKMDSIKTIMASTGESVDTVNKYLNELNEYSDQTIYSFSDMTQNIGKFTNAGVKLEDAVLAIKGISNEAAVSGANANEASRAMYNFAQALSAGHVKLIDWKSIENANMATVEFKEQLIASAVAVGTLTKTSDGMYKTVKGNTLSATKDFNETLQDQWMTTDVLVKTLKNYADKNTDIGEKAFAAAQDVTKLTQVFDILKETAQSGWARTWEIIFGDIEEAKAVFTPMTEFLGGMIEKMDDFRNSILEGALGSPFESLAKKLETVTGAVDGLNTITKKVGRTTEEYENVINEVMRGEWGVMHERWNKLTEAGYDWARVQNTINERLGYSKRHVSDYAEAQTEATEAQAVTLEQLVQMSDKQLKQLNLTDAEIKSLRSLEEQAEKTGIPLQDLVKDMDQLNGRTLLINAFANAGKALGEVFKAMGNAWTEIFPPESTSRMLYDFIAALHKCSTYLEIDEEAADKLKRTFKGLFAIIDVITTITGGAFKFAFKALSELLGIFDTDILSVTANIGDAVVGFRDWIDSVFDVSEAFERIAPALKNAANSVKDWIAELKNSKNLPKDIISGLVQGLLEGVSLVWDAATQLGNSILESICEFLGIHSPSTKMIEVGKNTIEGLIAGLKEGATSLWDTAEDIASKLADYIKNIDYGTLFAAGISIGMLFFVKKISDIMETLTAPLSFLEDLSGVMGGLTKSLKASAVSKIAISIALLAGAVAILALVDPWRLLGAVAAIAALAGVIVGLSAAVGKFGPKESVNLVKMSVSLAAMATALLIVAVALRTVSGLSGDDLAKGGLAIAGIVGAMSLMVSMAKGFGKDVGRVGTTLIAMSLAMLLMITVMKQMAKLDASTVQKGALGIVAMVAVFKLLTSSTSSTKKVGATLLAISAAMVLLIGVAKLICGMTWGEMTKSAIGLLGFVVIIAAMIKTLKMVAGKDLPKIGGTLLAIAIAIGVLGGIGKLISGMSWGEMAKAMAGLAGLVGVIAGLMFALKKMSGTEMPKVALTLLAMSVAIGVLGGIAVILGFVNLGHLAKGIAAVGLLAGIMSMLIIATKDAKECKGELITLTVALGIMAASIAVLSLIDPNRLAGATVAMSIVMGMFALMMKMSGSITSSMKSLIVITIAVGLIAGLLAILSNLPIETTLTNAAAMGVLLVAIASSMAIIGKTQTIGSKALIAMGAMTLIIGALGVILYLIKDLPVESTISNVTALSILLGTMTAVITVLSIIGPLAASADAAMIALAKLAAGIVAVILILGGLSKIPGFNELIADGGETLSLIGYALGKFVGSIVGGFTDGAFSGMPAIAEHLAAFMTNLQPFLDGAANIKPESMEGVKTLAEALLILTGANLLDSLAPFLSRGDTLTDFATQLKPFGEALVEFSGIISGNIDEAAVTAAGNAGKLLAEMAATIPNTGGVVSWFTGENDIVAFGTKLTSFGWSMVSFSNIVSGNIDEGAVTAAANAGKMLAEMATTLPNTGGVVTWFTGGNDIDTFGSKLVSFGWSIVSFSNTVAGRIDEAAITAAANAGKVMSELAATLPNTGGAVTWFTGDNDISLFGTKLASFGKAMVEFSDTVKGNIDEASVSAATSAASALAALANNLPDTGGMISWFKGDNDMETFGNNLVHMGGALSDFSASVSGVDSTAMSMAISQVISLTNLAKSMNGVDYTSFVAFSASLGQLARKGIDSFVGAFTGAGAKVSLAITGMINIATHSITNQSPAITQAFATALNNVTASITGKKQAFSDAGKLLVTSFADGIKDNSTKPKDEVTSMGTKAADAADDSYSSFYSAGSYLVDGFAAGIDENTFKAEAKAKAMASAALAAAQSVLKINSPSKVFMAMGTAVPEGFAMGIDKLRSMVTESSTTMANSAIDTFGNSISRLATMIGSDIDTQPTIRPVLDLSDVRSGAGAINGLLGTGSVGVMANVGAINSMMRNRSQNGTNGDVVAAINKLRSDLGNIGGDQYNVNGITYDDGSNVNNAVKSLVRAVKMDRRV